MSYVQPLLARDERVVRVARTHWATMLPTVLVDGALILVISGLTALGVARFPPYTWFGLLLLFVPIGHLLVRATDWRSTQTIVTNRRIIQIRGMIEKHVSDTLIEKVNDIVTSQSAWGRMLNFGDLQLITGSEAGTDFFQRIADPVGFKKDLLDQRRAAAVQGRSDEPWPPHDGSEVLARDDIPDLIRELAELRDKGLLTDTEFEAKKQQLLDRI